MKLRNAPRVHLMERTNARLLEPCSLAASDTAPTLLVMDVSFISATLLLPPVLAAAPGGRMIYLVGGTYDVKEEGIVDLPAVS